MGFSNCFVSRLSLGCFYELDKNNFSRAGTFPTYEKLPFPSLANAWIHVSEPVYINTQCHKISKTHLLVVRFYALYVCQTIDLQLTKSSTSNLEAAEKQLLLYQSEIPLSFNGFYGVAVAVQRQRAIYTDYSGSTSPALGRHISTFRGYRILFSIINPYINRFTNHFSIHS